MSWPRSVRRVCHCQDSSAHHARSPVQVFVGVHMVADGRLATDLGNAGDSAVFKNFAALRFV